MEDEYKPTEAYQALLDYYGEYAPDIIKANGNTHEIRRMLEHKYGIKLNELYSMRNQLQKAFSRANLKQPGDGQITSYTAHQGDGWYTYVLGGKRDNGTDYTYNITSKVGPDGTIPQREDMPSTYQEGNDPNNVTKWGSPFQFYDDYASHIGYQKVFPGVYRNANGNYIYNDMNHKSIIDAEKAERAKYEKKKADAKAAQASQPTAQAEPSPALQNLRGITANRVAKNNLA